MSAKQIAFLLKRGQPQTLAVCQTLIQTLKKRNQGEEPFIIADSFNPPFDCKLISKEKLPKDLHMLVVLGGDGTLLHGASLLTHQKTPILGVNLGHLGFLSTCSQEEAAFMLESALDGKLPIEERARLHCKIYQRHSLQRSKISVKEKQKNKEKPKRVLIEKDHKGFPQEIDNNDYQIIDKFALNEIVFSQPTQARLFELETYLDEAWITTYKADGLIISTPTGSTAYNLAAGGPILPPQIKGVVITPICPHTLTARPLVVPMSSTIYIKPMEQTSKILITLDGGWNLEMKETDFVHITQAKHPIQIFRTPDYSFFDVLRKKLHWGSRGDEST